MSKKILAVFSSEENIKKAVATIINKGIDIYDISVSAKDKEIFNYNAENLGGTIMGNNVILGFGTMSVPGMGIVSQMGNAGGLIAPLQKHDSIKIPEYYMSIPISIKNGGIVSKTLKKCGANKVMITHKS